MAMDALQDMPHVPKGLISTYADSEAATGNGDVVLYVISSDLPLGLWRLGCFRTRLSDGTGYLSLQIYSVLLRLEER